MGIYYDYYKKEQEKKERPKAQQMPVASPVKPARPVQPVQKPAPMPVAQPTQFARNPQSVTKGLENIGKAVYNGGAGLMQTIAADPAQFAKDTVNGLIVNPVKEVATHPVASLGAFGGGAIKGTAALPQNVQNLVADIQDAYMGREGYSKKWNYMPTLVDKIQGNPLYENYKQQKALAPTMTEFGDFLGAGAGIGGVAGATTKGVSKLSKTAKVAKETSRIADKLADAQKLKYASQIEKLAAKNVANNIAKENIAKAAAQKTFGNQLKQNATMGAVLGSLEGDNLEDKAANALQMGALGGLLTGAHGGVSRLGQTRPGRIARVQTKKFIKNASNIPAISQAIAGLDYAFNTNNSRFANDLTRKRREFYKSDAKNDNLSRNITEEQHKLLEQAGELTPEQQLEIFERNKYGDKKFEERKTTPKTDEKVQEDINPQVQEKNAKSANEQSRAKTFEEIMQEDYVGSKVKEPIKPVERKTAKDYQQEIENIRNKYENKPAEGQIKADEKMVEDAGEKPVAKVTKSDVTIPEKKPVTILAEPKAKRFNGQLPQKYYKGKLKYPELEGKVTRLEPGKAEGADYSQEAWYRKEKLQNEEVEGYNTEKADMYNNNIWEDKNYEGKDSELGTTKYKSEDPEMIKFMDAYDKAEPKVQKKMLNDKLKSLGSQEEQIKFFEDFKAEQERKTDMNRPHKVGDVDVPTNEVEHLKDINEAFENNKHSKSADFDRDFRIIEKQKQRARQKAIEEANKLFDKDGNEADFEAFPTHKNKDYLLDGFGGSKIRTKADNFKWVFEKKKLHKEYKNDTFVKDYINDADNARKQAVDIKRIGKELNINTKDYNIFDTVDKKILKNSGYTIVETKANIKNNAIAYTNPYTKNIIIDIKFGKTKIAEAKRHEMQHIIDNEKLGSLPKEHPVSKFMDRWNKEYSEAVDRIKVLTEKISSFSEYLTEDGGKFFNEFAEAVDKNLINLDNVDKYIQKVDNVFKNDNYKRIIFNEYLKSRAIYGSSPKEIRAFNSQFGIKNKGDIIDDYTKLFTQRYGEIFSRSGHRPVRGVEVQGIGREKNEGIRNEGRRQTDYLQRGLDKEVDASNATAKTEFTKLNDSISTIKNAFDNLSKSREDWFRKYGTYTDERMKNRLFKQSKDGEGIYFQQSAKGDGYIDWGSDRKSEKAGFTGKKVYEGLKQKGTIQAALNRMFETQVRMSHIDGQIEFLKKNFSEQKDGFVPVNSKLLANAMFWGKSKAWYETLSKGKEAISKTFDEANAKEWQELFDTTDAANSDLYLPKDIYDLCLTGDKELPTDYLKTYGKKVGSKDWFKGKAKQAAALLDFYNDRFKRKVLTSATFFMNNRFGNQIMLMANSKNPMDYLKGIHDAIKMKDSDIPNEILESTLSESVKQESMNITKKYWSEKDNGVDTLARILNGDRIKLDNLEGLKKLKAIGINIAGSYPNLLFRKISEFSGNVNDRMERFERKQAYSQVLSKLQKKNVTELANKINGTIEIAKLAKENPVLRQTVLDSVADILGDYNNFSKFERNVMKRIIPFYAWDRTIIRHAIALGKDNPVKLALIGLETYRLLNDDNGLEDYQHGALKTNIRNKRTGSKLVINKARYIPYATLFELLDSDDRVGSVTPALTKVGEAAKGEKNFLHSEISSKNYKRITKDGKQGYLNIKTGEFKEGKAPLSVRAGYLAKEGYEFLYPHTRSALTSGYADLVKHYAKTGEILFPDKPYDASLGGLYHGDYAGKAGKYTKTQSAANRLDLPYQLINKYGGAGLQPEHLKERTKKYKQKHKRK